MGDNNHGFLLFASRFESLAEPDELGIVDPATKGYIALFCAGETFRGIRMGYELKVFGMPMRFSLRVRSAGGR